MGLRVTATARVQLTVEIVASSHWGDNCQIDQVHRQAAEDALAFLRALPPGQMRIIGEPRVLVVITEQER